MWPIGPIGPPGGRAAERPSGRAAGERAGVVDVYNYKTWPRLHESLGSTLFTKPQQEDVLKRKWPKATFSKDKTSIRLQQFQQTTRLSSDYKTFDR